ncbi:DNA-binding transcriptional activator of the SARP family [Amycolatopsis marina]|uniref:DNA-binding transcriptional activator of the SARP family n=1 Tax=Amycolatopsis marina TaxID=490629 RepID=A0A1I1CE63_9PSEU|nr:BTAD domain-containing putative transcriptional regulator [Amycolatopsis marina]SFB60372.1 DNA-binding transcriptional activator of the SARP family [Amycolatopsis marina]
MNERDIRDGTGPDVRIQLLGPVQLLADGRAIPVGGPGVRGLLALLALDANKVVTLDDIIDALWGHEPPATARTIVHGNVSHLRRVLRSVYGEKRADSAESARIRTAPPGYQLHVDPDRIDVHRARALLERAAVAPLALRADLLLEAFALWQGPVLGGVPQSVAAPALEELRLAVHGARVDADLELGRHAELIAELTPMVRENPAAERTVGQLMLALYRAGRRADALDIFRQVSRYVNDQLGIDPGPELRQLHDRLLQDDLDGGNPGVTVPLVPAQLPAALPVLAGRSKELEWLDQLGAGADAGAGAIGVVTGTAGVGKSALVVWWAHRAAGQFVDGVLFASLRGFDPRTPALNPAEVLNQFLLGLGVAAAELPEQLHERVALYRSLLAGRRVLVVLDDAGSAEQVRPLLPPGARSMTLVTSRSRLDGLTVSNTARVRALDVLAPADAVRLIEDLAGATPDGRNERLAKLCGYLPLALRIAGARLAGSPPWIGEELLKELADERTRLAALEADGGEASLRAALDLSYRGLAAEHAATLRVIGVLPLGAVDPHLIAALCGVEVGEARNRLRLLASQHLLAEPRQDRFTPHDLVRLYVRDLAETELTGAERAELLADAVWYYQAVADRARRRLLRIVDPLEFSGLLPEGSAVVPALATFDEALDWFAAEWANLLAVIEAASAAGAYEDAWQLARVAHTYRVVRPWWDEWSRLVELGLTAAEAAGSELGRCWMLISRCAVALTFGLAEGSLTDAEAALDIARDLQDDRLRISAEIHVGCALVLAGRDDEAIARLLTAIEETERTGDLALQGQALNNCAEAEKRAGRYSEAITHQLASLRVDRKLGDDSYAVVSLNNLAELHFALCEHAEAERYAREALELTVARGFVLQEGVARFTLGRILGARGNVSGARQQLTAALELHERVSPRSAVDIRAELERLRPADA